MKFKKVLVIGIDGMDPGITKQLMEEGRLPNFQRLAENGSFINLNTSYPPHSPVAWTTLATGTNPGKHNVFDFIRRQPGSYLPELSLAKSASGIGGTNYESYVMSDPFWRITTKNKIPTTVIRWPVTFPPEKVKGNLLSGLGVPDIKGFLSGYTYYTANELTTKDKALKKIIKVEQGEIIKTDLFGPKRRKDGEIIDVISPMEIRLTENSADIEVGGKSHTIKPGEWSDWIRVGFKAGFRTAYGIFRAYLISLEPFEMYITTIQIDPVNPITDISFPDAYSRQLVEEIGLYYTLGMPEETDGLVDGKISDEVFLQQISQIEEERLKMFWKEFEAFKQREKGLLAFVFDASDRVQHVFWDEKVLEESTPGIDINPAVEKYWERKDEFLGKVLDQIDEATLLLVLSDHGFTSFERSVSLNTWLVQEGFMKAEIDEDAIFFETVDWSQTQAYALGFNSIYINQKGREPEGIVQNKELVIQKIIAKLEGLKDEKTRQKVVNRAYPASEVWSGPYMKNGPDIIVGFNPGYRASWQTAVGKFSKEVIEDNDKAWDGDHLVDPKFVPGVLFSNQELKTDTAGQTDIAPTVLDALGLPIPEEMEGQSLIR
ncbi:MAG: alkaline phosphatase family protein [Nanoarchaeota archaeon]|nr:alkaline phosphatase family protein [Nanoarchaeota archaeon]